MGQPVRRCARAAAAKIFLFAGRENPIGCHLDHAGPMRGSLDERTIVVVAVDALLDVCDKELGQLFFAVEIPPVPRIVVFREVQSRGTEQVHTGFAVTRPRAS
jgi:hypothetical protein